MYWSRPSVCLSLAAYPHYFTDPDVTWGNCRGATSCALLGGFAIGARVNSLLRQQHRTRNVSECSYSLMCLVFRLFAILNCHDFKLVDILIVVDNYSPQSMAL